MNETILEDPAGLGVGTRKLTVFLHTTLDGFIANSDGGFWERFVWGEDEMKWNNEQFRQADTWVFGRTAYETIVPWWTAVATGTAPGDAGELSAADREFAEMLTRMTKVVISRTLDGGEDRDVIADDLPGRLEELKRRPGPRLMLTCGPGLLSELAPLGLIDEYLVILHPAAIGEGVPLFAPLTREVQLDLIETKNFDGGAIALRYRSVAS